MSFMGARVAVKPCNGEFLSFECSGKLTSVNCCDDAVPEIIFSVPLAINNAYIQTHTRDMITVRENGHLGIKSRTEQISESELFDFICLGLNRVAIRAHNGMFVSFKPDQNKLMCADSSSIGPNETFEVIVVFK